MPAHLFDPKPNTNQGYHVDANGNEYFGDAPRGALTSDAKWRIYAMFYDNDQGNGSWLIKYPDGKDTPMFIWDNVEAYTYMLLRDREPGN